jgi:hypothetical protein
MTYDCTTAVHKWPPVFTSGESCNCGRFYLSQTPDGFRLERGAERRAVEYDDDEDDLVDEPEDEDEEDDEDDGELEDDPAEKGDPYA